MANAKNFLLGIAIAIVFMLFSVYGILLVYSQPQFSDFCGEKEFGRPFPLERQELLCEINLELRAREQQCFVDDKTIINREYDEEGCLTDFECSSCNQDFDKEENRWRTNFFVASIIIGILGIAIGAFLFKIEAIGAGLMGGGAFLIFVGSVRAWQDLGDLVRFVILGIALASLIYIGFLINRRRKH